MTPLFAILKGRLVVVLVAFLSLSHFLGLWLYVQKGQEATTPLHPFKAWCMEKLR